MFRNVACACILSLSACGAVPGVMSQGEFSRKYAEQLCDRTFDCDEAGAEALWGTEDDCQKETSKDLRSSYDNACDYEGKAARQCLKSFKELACNPHFTEIQAHIELCESVWECGE